MEIKDEVIENNSGENSALQSESTVVKKEEVSEFLGLLIKMPKPTKIKNEGKNNKVKNFECDECDKKFNARARLAQHKNIHKNFKCKTCGKIMHLKFHFDKHKCLICKICNKFFRKPSLLAIHSMIHNMESRKKFECDFCGKVLYRKGRLSHHIIEFHLKIDKPFKCDICNKDYSIISTLRNHMSHHNKSECKFCHKLFSVICLNEHIQQVHFDDNYTCNKCPCYFKSKSALKYHKSMHNKKYACKICKKKFKFAKLLAEHQVIHEKTYPCLICKRTFKRSYNLKNHMKIGDCDKKHFKYHCKKCEYVTDGKKRFEEHQEKHENYAKKLKSSSYKFKCKKCPALHKNRSNLNSHVRMTHGNKFMECDFCGKTMQLNKKYLIIHFKNVHKKNL